MLSKWRKVRESNPRRLLHPSCFQDSFLDQPDTFRVAVGVGVEPTPSGSGPDVLPLDHPTAILRAGMNIQVAMLNPQMKHLVAHMAMFAC